MHKVPNRIVCRRNVKRTARLNSGNKIASDQYNQIQKDMNIKIIMGTLAAIVLTGLTNDGAYAHGRHRHVHRVTVRNHYPVRYYVPQRRHCPPPVVYYNGPKYRSRYGYPPITHPYLYRHQQPPVGYYRHWNCR